MPVLHPYDLALLDAWLRAVLWDSHLPSTGKTVDDGIGSVTFRDGDEVNDDDAGLEIHRMKGYVALADGSARVIQGVREVFEIRQVPQETDENHPTDGSAGKIVLIGRGLDLPRFEASLQACLKSRR